MPPTDEIDQCVMRVEQKIGNIWEWNVDENQKQDKKAQSKKVDDNPSDFFAQGLFDEIPLSDDEEAGTQWYYEIKYQQFTSDGKVMRECERAVRVKPSEMLHL